MNCKYNDRMNYGLDKIHKALENGIPTFRPILSAIGKPTYKLAKFCDKLLKPITTNEYTIKALFSFAKEIDHNLIMVSFNVESRFSNIHLPETISLLLRNSIETIHILIVYPKVEEFDPNLIMPNFDVKSLFINITFPEINDLCIEKLYGNHTHIDSLSKSSFRSLLQMTIYESIFIADQKYYK